MTQTDVMIIMINTNAPENSHFSYLSYHNNYYSITPLLTRTLNQNQINTNLSGIIHKILLKTEAKTNSNDTHIRCINWWYTHSMQILLPATASVNPRLSSLKSPERGCQLSWLSLSKWRSLPYDTRSAGKYQNQMHTARQIPDVCLVN